MWPRGLATHPEKNPKRKTFTIYLSLLILESTGNILAATELIPLINLPRRGFIDWEPVLTTPSLCQCPTIGKEKATSSGA